MRNEAAGKFRTTALGTSVPAPRGQKFEVRAERVLAVPCYDPCFPKSCTLGQLDKGRSGETNDFLCAVCDFEKLVAICNREEGINHNR